MANDSKQYPEEEYLFSEEQQTDPLNPTESEPEAQMELEAEQEPFFKKQRKNILVGVGLVVVVFIVYKIIGSFFSSDDIKSIPPIVPTTTQPISQSANASLTGGVPATANAGGSAESSLSSQVNLYNQNRQQTPQVGQLESAAQTMTTQVSSLQDTMQGLQSSVNGINAQLSQLNDALVMLANQMQQQEQRWFAAQKKVAAPKVVVKARPVVVKRDNYQTLAVIPGRAWLKSSRGATLTVSNGSTIPGYGTVTAINTQSGKVVTSSGSTIEYAPNDE